MQHVTSMIQMWRELELEKKDDGDKSENFRAYFLHIYSDKVFIDF